MLDPKYYKKFVLLGPPGAGKGTQADRICKILQIPKISTGDMLRQAVRDQTVLGKQADSMMRAGQLVTVHLILELMTDRLSKSDCQNGYLLDGFPRNLEQAKLFHQKSPDLDCIIQLVVSDPVLITRLTGRRVHLNSGRAYHVVFNPPKIPNLDDLTGEPLVQRTDDTIETVQARLNVYRSETLPLVHWYETRTQIPVFQVSGEGDFSVIEKNILNCLSVLSKK